MTTQTATPAPTTTPTPSAPSAEPAPKQESIFTPPAPATPEPPVATPPATTPPAPEKKDPPAKPASDQLLFNADDPDGSKAAAKKIEDDKAATDKAAADKVAADKELADRLAKMTPEEKAAYDKEQLEKNPPAPPEVKFEDLKIPDDMTVPDALKADVLALAKKQGWTQEQTQDAIDLHVKVENMKVEEFQKMKIGWKTETENDATYGQANLKESLNKANEVVRLLGDDQLKDDLILLGLGNKLSVMRFLNKIHPLVKEKMGNDTIGDGGKSAPAAPPVEAGKSFWPNMK